MSDGKVQKQKHESCCGIGEALGALTKQMVTPVLLLVGSDWYLFCFKFHFDWERHPELAFEQTVSVRVWGKLAAFTLIITMLFWSYLKTILTSSFVKHYPPPDDLTEKELASISTCFRCGLKKPRRCHHCSSCGTCVLKMDHHCPWVANCVGIKNYKFFILFILYATLGCWIFTANATHVLYSFYGSHLGFRRTYDPNISTMEIVCTIVTVFFGLVLTSFLIFHTYLISINKSTLEFLGPKKPSPYSRGSVLGNFEDVFGPLSARWFFPIPSNFINSGWKWDTSSEEESVSVRDLEDGLQTLSAPLPGGLGLGEAPGSSAKKKKAIKKTLTMKSSSNIVKKKVVNSNIEEVRLIRRSSTQELHT